MSDKVDESAKMARVRGKGEREDTRTRRSRVAMFNVKRTKD